MSLREYSAKRNFKKTREPPTHHRHREEHIFVIQKHYASHLHYDFRLELDGVLKSWAVPKGPPTRPKDKRLAVEVEDHPVAYAKFEGTIPAGQYGAGKVEIWDEGIWSTEKSPHAQLKKGHLDFELKGSKLAGHWTLVRTSMPAKKANWLLIKRPDHKKPLKVSEKIKSAKPIKKSAMPEFIKPALCKILTTAPSGQNWIHEIKYDGYRTHCRFDHGKIQLLTRSGLDWTKRYPELAQEAKKIKAKHSAYIDGEIVWVDDKGQSRFGGLQKSLEENDTGSLLFYAFDLLHLDGQDLMDLPLLERKEMLAELLEKSKLKKFIFSDHHEESGRDVYHSACDLGLEGIISKDANSTYESGRTSTWLKIKCKNVQEFIIAGYTLQKDSNTLGALVMAEYSTEKKKNVLRYIGKVGTGFNQANSASLMKKLSQLKTAKTNLIGGPKVSRGTQWVKPILIANIEFGAWTSDHILRHAVFKGLREDKPAKEVTSITNTEENPSVTLSHANKVLYPKEKITKQDVADYYQAMGKHLLPHIQNRPLSLLRCPQGISKKCFFQKHLNDETPIISVSTMQEILELVQINTLEFHAWNCTVDDLTHPKLIVFDLDPDPGVKWSAVKKAANELKNILYQLGLKSFVNLSGNKGLHVHVPIAAIYEWDEVKNFSRSICAELVNARPDLYTINLLKKNRKNKIFLDYLRNGEGSTAIVPYSLRAKESAAIAIPISWNELGKIKSSVAFTLKDMQKFSRRADPWKDYFKLQQKIKILDKARKLR